MIIKHRTDLRVFTNTGRQGSPVVYIITAARRKVLRPMQNTATSRSTRILTHKVDIHISNTLYTPQYLEATASIGQIVRDIAHCFRVIGWRR
jgi:hypothetical protein